MTEVFDSYRKYAGFSIRLCRGFDPESKGKIAGRAVEAPRCSPCIPGREAKIVLDEQGVKVSFCDTKTGELLAEHTVETGVGHLVKLPRNAERFGSQASTHLKDKLLKSLDGFDDAKIYVEWLVARLKPRAARHASRLIEKYPRYVRDQLRIMYQCVTGYSRDELQKALDYCVSRDLVSANDFRDTLVFFRQDEPKIAPTPVTLPAKYRAVAPKVRNIADYLKDGTQKGGAR